MSARVLTPADVAATVAAIAQVQDPDGSIAWFEGGMTDPWDHVEAAMALDVGGRHAAARRAYRWLEATQRPDGAWHSAYREGAVTDGTLDTNMTGYVAAGVWMHLLTTGDLAVARSLFACVERSLDFVLEMQGEHGEIWWARDHTGRPWRRGLVAGSASLHHSLACALRLADAVGCPQPRWETARRRLGVALRTCPAAFEDKRHFAMDWYYPVLCGVTTGEAARSRLSTRWREFVVHGRGVRCVSDRPWITAAETCELALALVRIGEIGQAAELVEWAQHLRGDDAAYWTGANFTDGAIFPQAEQPTWTAAAVVLAADAVDGGITRRWLEATG